MTTFLTGATGYLGSYVAAHFLRSSKEPLSVLVRAENRQIAVARLWNAWQLHMGVDEFFQYVDGRVRIHLGDISQKRLGFDQKTWDDAVGSTSSIIHCAASLNRKSSAACFQVNLKGTLEMILFARAAHDAHGLRRFSEVSTVAVAGKRQDESILEDQAIEWNRSDYDPYARTKKFCEHMVHELLPDVPKTIFRPSIVLGDSRFPQTTQFDMVRAFVWLAHVPVLPFDKEWRADIVPADYVGRAISEIHQKDRPRYEIYHLSSGRASLTYGEIIESLKSQGFGVPHVFARVLAKPFFWTTSALSYTPRSLGISRPASLLKVFLPYLTFNTVFENQRVCEELGERPAKFSDYAYGLMRFAIDNRFQYPHQDLPENSLGSEAVA